VNPIAKYKQDRAKKIADDMAKREIDRRQWCVQQAVWLDEVRGPTVLVIAEMLYEYVWGKREA
jgi:hypothetical protein